MLTAAARLQRLALVLLVGCTLSALAGYATFGLHPEWMTGNAATMRAYAAAMTGFPRAHILLGAIALAIVLARGTGRRWLVPAVLLYAVSLSSELLGTTVGLPFGSYHYTDALGAKWLGRVPMLIPLSWFTMSVSAFVIARRRLGTRRSLTTVFISALLLVAWDLALDPAMSRLAPYWVWGAPGRYFGMPLLNLAGWYVTGAALSGILVAAGAARWVDALAEPEVASVRWIYGANLAMPVGMTLAAGLAGAAAASLGILGVVFGISVIRDVRLARIVRRSARSVEAWR